MDQAEFDALMARAPQPPKGGGAVQPASEGMDPQEFNALIADLDKQMAANRRPDGTLYSEPPSGEPAMGDPSGLDAIFGGGLKSVFETKDFLFGEAAPEERSEFRRSVETTVDLRRDQSLYDGFAAGISQFGVAMVGLGKMKVAAEALPWFGRALGPVSAALPKTAETVKAATAGAVAFDPYEERLSNLVESTPLANPVTAWLAASPDDTAAEGRVKAAFESIGLDAAILGTFLGATKVWKALRAGDSERAASLVDNMEAGRADQSAEATVQQTTEEGRTDSLASVESTTQAEAQSVPAGSPESASGIPEAEASSPSIALADEDTEALLNGMSADADAIAKAGGWYQAIEAGHTFGRGAGIPYVKLNLDRELDDFMARVVDLSASRLDDLKGGAVLTDARVSKTVEELGTMFNADPGTVLGMIQTAGDQATALVAKMEAGYLVSNRMMQDSFALATRIRLGDFSEFGSRQAAMDALGKRLALATSVYGAARSMTAASGRAMRRMRGDFGIDPEAVKALEGADPERMVQLLADTGGDPKALARLLAEPTLWEKTKDYASFLLVNNLVSGPKTHLVNMVSNGFMVVARPLERMLGSAAGAATGDIASRGIFKQSLRQYTYLGAAFTDAFGVAKRAFIDNDSILAPHRTEAYAGNRAALRSLGGYKAWDSPGSILHNALVATVPVVGLPTRFLGFTDELAKQVTYRSKVMAAAHEEAFALGLEAGHTGKALRDYVGAAVRERLDAAFDAQGRGTDAAALKEAQTATFQTELAPGSLGEWGQTGADTFFPLKVMLPFVKTPTNLIRYGWKLTPGLNMVQREFRDMLAGKMGAEAQAQATGQMMLGGLFMGTAAYLVSQGTITGGGPSDYQTAQALRATGWQPYSVVLENEDGTKTYVPFGKVDPAAISFGIIADLMDAINAMDGEETPETKQAIGGLLIALGKQFADRSYLQGVSQALEALSDPETRLAAYAGQTTANFIPYSAAMRQLNADPHMRDARTLTDKLMATIPGMSEKVPARLDAWGDPVLTRKGLWSSEDDQLVDREVQRLILEGGGSAINRPQPVHSGVDLRELTMSDGKNAYAEYQLLAGHPPVGPSLKDLVAKRMQSKAYQLAPDGPSHVKGTKLWLLHPIISGYRERALKMLKRDPLVRDAFRADDLKARQQLLENRAKASSGAGAALKPISDAFGAGIGQ